MVRGCETQINLHSIRYAMMSTIEWRQRPSSRGCRPQSKVERCRSTDRSWGMRLQYGGSNPQTTGKYRKHGHQMNFEYKEANPSIHFGDVRNARSIAGSAHSKHLNRIVVEKQAVIPVVVPSVSLQY
jgi:hypothetical protein